MSIIGFVTTMLGGIIHANIAIRCANDWKYWALLGALVIVYIGGYILGMSARKENEND